ncbi:hypothetical protein ACFWZU_15425 [Frateuria sp. GZRR33]|uniref:hypothetical protein n=1 Tax=Frateuria sp. GZRR33 TaxID=3351535 RepID=UPI003EDBEF9A
MEHVIEGFREAFRVAYSAAALATAIVMLMACGDLLLQGHYASATFFGTGSCVLLKRSVDKAWALIRPNKKEQEVE